MTRPTTRSYRFGTAAQWGSGILARATLDAEGRAQPFAPYTREPRHFALADGACAPAFSRDGSGFWRAAHGPLYRLAPDAAAPVVIQAGGAILHARRLAPGRRTLWVASRDGARLYCYGLDDFGVLSSVDIGAAVVDLADDGRDGVWVLAQRTDGAWLLHVDCAGQTAHQSRLPADVPEPAALIFLRARQRIVLLAQRGELLCFFGTDGVQRQAPLPVAVLRPCCTATQLGGDGRERIVLGGVDHEAMGGQAWVIVADAFGDSLDQIDIGAPATGVAGHADRLLVTTAHGADDYPPAGPTDVSAPFVSCEFITPVLHSPPTGDDRGWLRAELDARLPRGTLLTVEYAATDQAAVRDAAARIAQDETQPPQARQARLARLLEPWSAPIRFAGGSADGAGQTVSAPLFTVQEPYLWLRIRLGAPPGTVMPQLTALRVLYPNLSLMQDLPAIFRQDDQDLLRALVGVLETTTQGLDRRIASIGSLLEAASTSGEWLDAMARWLGLPWDDALDLPRKRALMRCGPEVMAMRGTRAALEALLTCLFPGTPRRFRVLDYSADVELTRIGGAACPGIALPALLPGLPLSACVPNRKAVLGHARLPCSATAQPPMAPPAGILRIDIAADAADRKAWEPWLAGLVDAVVPVTTRVLLRWRPPSAGGSGMALNDALVLGGPADASLGSNAILGHARLLARRPMSLSESGVDLGFDLQ